MTKTTGGLCAVLPALLLLPAPAGAALEFGGAQVHPWWTGNTSDVRERELDALAEAGATTLRMDLPWTAVEPVERGGYDAAFLGRVDTFVAAARVGDPTDPQPPLDPLLGLRRAGGREGGLHRPLGRCQLGIHRPRGRT